MRACPTCQAPLGADTTFCTGCGTKVATNAGVGPTPEDGSISAGTVVDGKYVVERVLGEGGMGVVYLARSLHTDVEVVIKAVRPEIAHRKDIRDRTLAEGKALARIDHPNVVQLKTVVVDDKALLLVMQYIEGHDLEVLLLQNAKAGRAMGWDEAIAIFRQVLGGVGAAHDEGVIHRDIKPANVLIRAKDNVVKVTDFGIAKPEEDAQKGKGDTKGIIGSVHYMSPEQVKGQRDLDRRVDIYALGIVLFEMLTGRVPFDSDNTYDTMRKQIEEPLPSVGAFRPDLPPGLDGVLGRACAKERDQRFNSCAEFRAALDALGGAVAGAPMGVSGTVPGAPAKLGTAATQLGTPVITGPGQAASNNWAPPTSNHGTITGQIAELPATQRDPGKSNMLWGVLAVGGVLGVVTTVLLTTGVIGGEGADDDGPAAPTATTTASETTTSQPDEPESPLAKLEGIWKSESQRELKAVIVGERVEFQVVDAEQFAPQPYVAGEARFVLHPLPEEGKFLVEDRIRPVPPGGHTYGSANARTTCVGIWREASGESLRAQLTDDRLDVDFAKIEPSPRNFVIANREVTSCVGLEKLSATKTPGVFRRP
jgi:tRNA A-37 threonylcarbamoyl transferase component Bud32